jgi:hypothetical protein
MMNFESKKIFVWLLLILPFVWGCDNHNDPRKNIDIVQEEVVPLKHFRLDSMIFHFSTENQRQKQITQMPDQIGCMYLEDIMGMGICDDSSTWKILDQFSGHKDMKDLQSTIEKTHSPEDIQSYLSQLSQAFYRTAKQLPKEKNPQIIFMNSGLAVASFAKKNNLFVGLDYYLYPDPLVKEFPSDRFPQYKKKNMQKQYLVSNAIFNWLSARYNDYDTIPPEQNDFLNALIYTGKIMYALDIALPDLSDSTKMMWTEKEYDWALENEMNIWKEMAKQEVMFGTRPEEIYKWFVEAPFTNAGNLPQNSSPQLGLWMGWKIVSAYMEKNPSVTIEQLWKERNNQKILSAFKPKI